MFGTLLKKMIRAGLDWLADLVPTESGLRSDLNAMLDGLSAHADATAFAMVLADTKREELQKEIEQYGEYDREALRLQREGSTAEAESWITLRIGSEEHIHALTAEYTALQQTAESQVADYRSRKAEIDARKKQLPKILADQRYVDAQQKFQKSASSVNPESAAATFDRRMESITLNRRAIQSRALLDVDPQIQQAAEAQGKLRKQRIQKAMKELEARIHQQNESPLTVDAEFEEIKIPNSAEIARKLLEAPRYPGLLANPVRIETRKEPPWKS